MPRDSLKLLLLVSFFRSFRVYWWPRIASWIVRYLEGCTHLPPDTKNKDVTPVHAPDTKNKDVTPVHGFRPHSSICEMPPFMSSCRYNVIAL